jgi:putative hydrolase of the HAD superfamily
MDDTLILWEIPVQQVWESAIAAFTPELDGFCPHEVYTAVHVSADWYWGDPERHRLGRLDLRKARREIGRLAFQKLGRTDFDLADKIADTYSTRREQTGVLSPGAIDILKGLRARGIRLAMITNGASDIQRAKIERFNLAPYFENILIEGEFACGKPDERVFRYSLDKLKVKPEDVWMVGDDLKFDIAPCAPLGIYSLWVDRNKGQAPDGIKPDKIIRSIAEIPDLL